MAVITIKPKDVIVPFSIDLLLNRPKPEVVGEKTKTETKSKENKKWRE
jgi:hypothetical protein